MILVLGIVLRLIIFIMYFESEKIKLNLRLKYKIIYITR